jgi:hypothetical protein
VDKSNKFILLFFFFNLILIKDIHISYLINTFKTRLSINYNIKKLFLLKIFFVLNFKFI